MSRESYMYLYHGTEFSINSTGTVQSILSRVDLDFNRNRAVTLADYR